MHSIRHVIGGIGSGISQPPQDVQHALDTVESFVLRATCVVLLLLEKPLHNETCITSHNMKLDTYIRHLESYHLLCWMYTVAPPHDILYISHSSTLNSGVGRFLVNVTAMAPGLSFSQQEAKR